MLNRLFIYSITLIIFSKEIQADIIEKWEITPYINISGEYNDNIYLKPTITTDNSIVLDSKEDIIYTISPGINFSISLFKIKITSSYSMKFYYYMVHKENNEIIPYPNFNISFSKGVFEKEDGSNFTITGKYDFSISSKNERENTLQELLIPLKSLTHNLFLSAKYLYSQRLFLQPTFIFNYISLEDTKESYLNDSESLGGGVNFGYLLTPKLSIITGYRYEYHIYESFSDSNIHSITVGGEHNITSKFSFNLSTGINFFKEEDASDFNNSYLLSLSFKNSFGKNVIFCSLTRNITMNSLFSQSVINRAIKLNLLRNFSEKVYGSIFFIYSLQNVLGQINIAQIQYLQSGWMINVQLMSKIYGSFSYNRFIQLTEDSNFVGTEIKDNKFTTTLGINF